MQTRHDVLIVGGGNAGISLAARLKRYGVKSLAVIEPNDRHYFQPLFSHVAGGRADLAETVRTQKSVMPRGVHWIHDGAASVDPDARLVTLRSGRQIAYGHLVVCPGLQLDWDSIPGLPAAMDSPHASSHYEYSLVEKTWSLLSAVTSGTVIFTMPSGPIKCGGAAQKPMYLACDYWRDNGVLQDIRVVMVQPYPTVFGMPQVDAELNRKITDYGIELWTDSELVSVDPHNRRATIRNNSSGDVQDLAYEVLNAVPPQSAPDWLKNSPLAATGTAAGFVDVDPQTLRHVRYPNVWSLGDAAGTDNSKSGGALREQAKVLAKNLVAARDGKPATKHYDGYSVCPFTVSKNTVVFAEFDADYRPQPSIPMVPLFKEMRASWVMDRDIFPQIYWRLILKGRA